MKAKISNSLTLLLDTGTYSEQRDSKHFHASGLRECGRKQVLGLLGYKEAKVSKPEWLRAAEAGNRIHDMVTYVAKQQGILEAAEQSIEVDPEYFVSGRVDAILCRNDNRRALEIKTMTSEKYKLFFPGNDKFEAACAQLQWYLFALRLAGGFLLAVNRDSLVWKEFTVLPDDEYILSLRARMRRLKAHLDNKTLPAGERGKGCHFCGFRGTDQCRSEAETDWL